MSRKYQSRTDLEELIKRGGPSRNHWRELTMRYVFTEYGNYRAVMWRQNCKIRIARYPDSPLHIETNSQRFATRFSNKRREIKFGLHAWPSHGFFFEESDIPELLMFLQAIGGLRKIRAIT